MPPPKSRTLLLLLAAATAASAQTQPRTPPPTPSTPHRTKPRSRAFQPPYNPDVILLDPAHGGTDDGANLGSDGSEKDFTLSFANRLRSLLTDKGFTVVLTHPEPTDQTTADQRVEIANRSRAVACLLLHASNSGHGIHLFTSSLTPPSSADAERFLIPWDSAQAASIPHSLALANELSTAMNGLRVPLVVGRASIRPIDSMNCPAVAIEITPARAGDSISDDTYQQHIAESIVTALTFWRQHAQAQIAAGQAAAQAAASQAAPQSTPPATSPRPRPRPAINSPDEVPLTSDSGAPISKPAPRHPAAGPPQ